MTDRVDVDTVRWVTLREAVAVTHRDRRTVQRWVRQGLVRTIDVGGVTGFHIDDLRDTEARMHRNQAATRRVSG